MISLHEALKIKKGLPPNSLHDMLFSRKLAGSSEKSDTKVYGYHVNPNEPDSFAAVTYLADAIGMTPAKMGTSSFDYGSWENAFFMPKPCMLKYDGTVAYYLDPNDYSRKLDGTPSDISNPDFEGNAMMEWGLIWYKFVGSTEDGEGYFYVSNRKIDDSYHCWCNYDANDNIIPHFYTAIYNSTLHNGKFRSLSGFALTQENGSGNTTGEQEITYCTANNTTDTVEWYTDIYADRILINALHVLISKSLNTRASFGSGLSSGGESAKKAYITGTMNNRGMFCGVTESRNSAVKTFGMENWWGCLWHRTAGCISVSHDYKVKFTYGTADGTTVNGYNSTGSGYISAGIVPSTNGCIKKFKYDEHGYIPFEVGDSSITYYGDSYYQNMGTYYLLAGGLADKDSISGAFCFHQSFYFILSHWAASTTLSCKPFSKETVTGYPCVLENSAGEPAISYKVFGNIVQNGTPSPGVPADVQSVGNLVTEGEYLGKYEIPVVTRSENNEPITTSIYLNKPLYKGDYIIKDKSGGKVHRKWGVKILNGTEKWTKGDFPPKNAYQFYTPLWSGLKSGTTIEETMSTHFVNQKLENGTHIGKYYNFYPEADLLPENATTDDFSSFLASEYAKGTPVTVYYPLETPTEEPIELPEIPTFKGTTIIETATEIQPENIKITYKSRR